MPGLHSTLSGSQPISSHAESSAAQSTLAVGQVEHGQGDTPLPQASAQIQPVEGNAGVVVTGPSATMTPSQRELQFFWPNTMQQIEALVCHVLAWLCLLAEGWDFTLGGGFQSFFFLCDIDVMPLVILSNLWIWVPASLFFFIFLFSLQCILQSVTIKKMKTKCVHFFFFYCNLISCPFCFPCTRNRKILRWWSYLWRE